MRRYLLSICLAICLTVASTRAADPKPQVDSPATDKTAATAVAEVTEPVIPKRELKFDVSEELYPLSLDVQGSYNLEQLIEQNYGRIDETMNFLSDRHVRQGTTLHSVVFYPDRGRFLLSAWGLPASNGPYRWFEYDERGVRILPKTSPPDRGGRPDQ